MKPDHNAPRLLGGAFLIQAVASGLSFLLLTSAIGTGTITDILVNTANNPTLVRSSILVELVTSMGIVFLAVMLYLVLRKYNGTIALVAFGLYIAEATILAVSKIGTLALIPLSQEFVQAGSPAASHFQALGSTLYHGVDRMGYDLHMVPFALGAVLFYYLFVRSGVIPRPLALFGLAAATLALVGSPLVLLGVDVPMVVFVPNLPFELTAGVWFLVVGVGRSVATPRPPSRARG